MHLKIYILVTDTAFCKVVKATDAFDQMKIKSGINQGVPHIILESATYTNFGCK